MPNTTTIYEWNNLSQPLQQLEWKSKTFITQKPVNLGAARVVADYPATGNVATNWEAAVDCWGIYVPQWQGLVPTPLVFPYPKISSLNIGLDTAQKATAHTFTKLSYQRHQVGMVQTFHTSLLSMIYWEML